MWLDRPDKSSPEKARKPERKPSSESSESCTVNTNDGPPHGWLFML